jgi:hypothetical protein
MHSHRKAFPAISLSLISLSLIFFGASLGGSAAANAAGTSAGTVSLSSPVNGAVQNLGVKLIGVTRTGGSSGAARVLCHTVNGTAKAGTDYTAVSQVLNWASGDMTEKYCHVPISDVQPFSGRRTFLVELSAATGAALGTPSSTVTIYGNEAVGHVALSAPTYTVAQNTGSVTITVDRAGGSSGWAAVAYATANGTAVAGTDYTSERGVIRWAGGDMTPKSFTIPISRAKAFTGTKTLAVAIASAQGAVLSRTDTSAIVTISGGTATTPPSVSLSASPNSVASGESSTVSWSARNATACTASGGWTGSVATSGSKATGTMTATKTYTLTCTGAGGSASQSATVAVSAPVSPPSGLSCTGTSGSLRLKASAVRDTGISPLLVFFDATGTTDSSLGGNATAFQDVSYSWNFGDTGASGTDTWAYGSNRGHNSRNTAVGGVAAHLYVTPGVDTAYVVTVTAHNGANTASCQLGVTAYDAAGANGFAGTATTCVSASGTPLAGSGGCPAGAAVVHSSSESAALNSALNSKRVLFKCGDTFSGGASVGGTKFSIGAYGGCEGTQTNRPILHGMFTIGTGTATDGRIADLDFESSGAYALMSGFPSSGNVNGPMTLYNLLSNGNTASFYWAQGTQWGLIDSVMTSLGAGAEGVYVNYAENNCVNGSSAYNCGGTASYTNVNYQALLGNSFNGASYSSGYETVRISACRLCVIENNLIENAGGGSYAVLKLHSGNTYDSAAGWIGQYTELVEISDNLFYGNSGAQLVEVAPQNAQFDERLHDIVVERNVFAGTKGGTKALTLSAVNATVRDNAFNGSLGGAWFGALINKRGIEYTGTSGAPSNSLAPEYVEVYNNTCYGGSACVGFTAAGWAGPANNSWAKNNLFYNASGGTVVSNSGTGNTVSNNTGTVTANPGFINGSSTFQLISDYKPTANYSGGTSVPVWYDALGALLSLTSIWDLGAVDP